MNFFLFISSYILVALVAHKNKIELVAQKTQFFMFVSYEATSVSIKHETFNKKFKHESCRYREPSRSVWRNYPIFVTASMNRTK